MPRAGACACARAGAAPPRASRQRRRARRGLAHSLDDRLAEARGLARGHQPRRAWRHHRAGAGAAAVHAVRLRQGAGDRRLDLRKRRSSSAIVDHAVTPVQQRNLETRLELQGARSYRASFSRSSAAARRRARAACRSSWRTSPTSAAGWCEAGPILSVSAAATASSADPARRRSRPTAA